MHGTSRLRSLADQATPPDGVVHWHNQDALDALAAHGPEMARLLADMADALALSRGYIPPSEQFGTLDINSLLARFLEIEERA